MWLVLLLYILVLLLQSLSFFLVILIASLLNSSLLFLPLLSCFSPPFLHLILYIFVLCVLHYLYLQFVDPAFHAFDVVCLVSIVWGRGIWWLTQSRCVRTQCCKYVGQSHLTESLAYSLVQNWLDGTWRHAEERAQVTQGSLGRLAARHDHGHIQPDFPHPSTEPALICHAFRLYSIWMYFFFFFVKGGRTSFYTSKEN